MGYSDSFCRSWYLWLLVHVVPINWIFFFENVKFILPQNVVVRSLCCGSFKNNSRP